MPGVLHCRAVELLPGSWAFVNLSKQPPFSDKQRLSDVFYFSLASFLCRTSEFSKEASSGMTPSLAFLLSKLLANEQRMFMILLQDMQRQKGSFSPETCSTWVLNHRSQSSLRFGTGIVTYVNTSILVWYIWFTLMHFNSGQADQCFSAKEKAKVFGD